LLKDQLLWQKGDEKMADKDDLQNMLYGYQICSRAEGKSNKTIDSATTAILKLQKYLQSHNYPTDVSKIDTNCLREFILYLRSIKAYELHPFTKSQDKGLSGHTINGYMRAIRAFWSWLVREEYISVNPFAKIKIPKAPKKVIPTFTTEQMQHLLGVISQSKPLGFRDWTIILTLLDTGMRASELTGMILESVGLKNGIIKVIGKGNKERALPIGSRVQKAIWKYMGHYRPTPLLMQHDALFLTNKGEPLTVNHLELIIKRHCKKAKIEGVRCSPHTFRHTFAITYLRNGGDVFSLQRILGHSSLEVVRMYVNLAEADVKAVHRRCSPADNMSLFKNSGSNTI